MRVTEHARLSEKRPLSGKHPIAAIEKRVIDSPAFADLSASAIAVLLLLARNLEKGRNGHVFVSAEDAERRGIATKTLYRCLRELYSHGFIYPTVRGGNGKCARWALTWLSLTKDTRGLHVDNFRPCAWRDWTDLAKKKPVAKMSASRGQIYRFAPQIEDKSTTRVGTKLPTLNLIPIGGDGGNWISAHMRCLAEHRLAGLQCFAIPAEMEASQ